MVFNKSIYFVWAITYSIIIQKINIYLLKKMKIIYLYNTNLNRYPFKIFLKFIYNNEYIMYAADILAVPKIYIFIVYVLTN